jgi:hypothetical protein
MNTTGKQYYGGTSDCTPVHRRPVGIEMDVIQPYSGYPSDEDEDEDECVSESYRAIPNEIQEIAKQIEILANVVEDLQIRLSPICKPVPEEVKEAIPDLPCGASYHARELRNLSIRVSQIRDRVESLLETIEL